MATLWGQRMSENAMTDSLPESVLYVKNGPHGSWWNIAKQENQIRAGWLLLPSDLIRNFDPAVIKTLYDRYYPRGTKQDFNALCRLLDRPSQHIWVTFEDRYLWWCLVRDGAEVSDTANDDNSAHFWLTCTRPWSNRSVNGNLLAISDLPGPVTKVAAFRGTVAKPDAWQDIRRVITGNLDPAVTETTQARRTYEHAMKNLIAGLNPKDFEHLIDLILIRSGWERVSTLGKTQEGIDLDVENPAINERAYVQVKSAAGQAELDDYLRRFAASRETYGRMIFAVHSPRSKLKVPQGQPVRIWTADETARLVVRLGLGERVEKLHG